MVQEDDAAGPWDGESFSTLYASVAPAILAWATVRLTPALRARLDPEDILQEVLCRAFDRFATWRPGTRPFRAWVFGIAHNVMREALRGHRDRPAAPSWRLSTQSLLDAVPDDASSVSRRLARDEDLQAFLLRLRDLTAFDRKLLIYRGLEGLEHAEVAAALGITVDSAEKSWQVLRGRLDAPAALLAG